MENKTSLMLRLLIDRYHPSDTSALLSYLPEDTAEEVRQCDVPNKDFSALFQSPEKTLKNIHYSWLEPVITTFPKELQGYLLSLLPNDQGQKLSEKMQIPFKKTELSEPLKMFLLQWLFDHMQRKKPIPLAYLPANSLSPLKELSQKELIELIDYLGLYDLAEEMRFIVDKKTIQTVQKWLSPKKRRFFQLCMQQRPLLKSKRMHLNRWKGNGEKLSILLHKKGLIRLGTALAGTHPDFIWHLTHMLDSGRAKILKAYALQEKKAGITKALVLQVMSLLKFLKTHKKKT